MRIKQELFCSVCFRYSLVLEEYQRLHETTQKSWSAHNRMGNVLLGFLIRKIRIFKLS